MRLLLPVRPEASEVTDDDLIELYAGASSHKLVRLNMAATVDGSATGADGRSGSINTDADHRVFGLLRAWADVVVAGSGTVRAEEYDAPVTEQRWSQLRAGRSAHPSLCVLSTGGAVPASVASAEGGDVFALQSDSTTSLHDIVTQLRQRGHDRVLLEGGPTIAGLASAAGIIEEYCLTWSPMVVGGDGPRIMHGPAIAHALEPVSLLESDGTLIGRWRIQD
ncbi:dihydrofolate reductase family protein [Rudaeicoccus suwonensis]|uniref:Riboflavin biosynthesis pyrimidine reductase n=1 Tax=Rudaeicoccus suwonensis TaxID=657409 RepID=A0A561EBG2_9MICO|nr:dihydrofolate reductase family protein [Rudaeicoccus suwonensis]TWE12927.1 riboflavin biosynthesis pyrimidine reductase [Rudaeicoccus suwonensis]